MEILLLFLLLLLSASQFPYVRPERKCKNVFKRDFRAVWNPGAGPVSFISCLHCQEKELEREQRASHAKVALWDWQRKSCLKKKSANIGAASRDFCTSRSSYFMHKSERRSYCQRSRPAAVSDLVSVTIVTFFLLLDCCIVPL